MKLVVLGANGRTGEHVLREALALGDTVTAVVRSEAKRPPINHDRLQCVIGDPCDPSLLAQVFEGQDAVISTLGGRRPTRHGMAIYWRSAEAIVQAAQAVGLTRVAVTSSALLFPSQRLVDRLLAALVHNVVQSATRMERVLQGGDLALTLARCGFLTDGEEARYRAAPGAMPKAGSSVSRRSLARFLVEEIRRPVSGAQVVGVSAPLQA